MSLLGKTPAHLLDMQVPHSPCQSAESQEKAVGYELLMVVEPQSLFFKYFNSFILCV